MKKLLMTATCLLVTSSALATEPVYSFNEISGPYSSSTPKVMTTYMPESQVMKDADHDDSRPFMTTEQIRKAIQRQAQEEQLKSANGTSEQAHLKKAVQQQEEMNRQRKMIQQQAQQEQLKSVLATEAMTSEQMHSRNAMNREAVRLTGKSAVLPQVVVTVPKAGSSGKH